jgi:ankyrin repeat protein
LTKAVSLGKFEAAKALVAARADLDAKDKGGWTPLMWAAELGKWNAAKFLIKKGADINAKDNAGWTPLVHAFSCLLANFIEHFMD